MTKDKELFFVENGLYASSSHIIDGNGFINVEVAVENKSDKAENVWIDIHMHQLIDTAKLEIAEEPGVMAAGFVKLLVPAGDKAVARTRVCVKNCVMWTPEKPILYVVEAVLYKPVPVGEALPNPKLIAGLAMREDHAMKMMDFQETRFGIRIVSVDAVNGLAINGEKTELSLSKYEKPETYADSDKEALFQAEYQKIKSLKEDGVKALCVRGAEMSGDFFDACNRLGMLVFDQVGQEDADRMAICHERSFPAVVAWMVEEQSLEDADSAELVRRLDATRPVGTILSADHGVEGDKFDKMAWYEKTELICDDLDFVVYPAEITEKRETEILFPNRVVIDSGF